MKRCHNYLDYDQSQNNKYLLLKLLKLTIWFHPLCVGVG